MTDDATTTGTEQDTTEEDATTEQDGAATTGSEGAPQDGGDSGISDAQTHSFPGDPQPSSVEHFDSSR